MSDCRNIIIFLSNLKSYPVSLAKKIGCERAVLWYELFRKYGDLSFPMDESIGVNLGILKSKDTFQSLFQLGFLEKDDDKYKINFEKLFESSDGASLNSEIKPPFTDSAFISLLSDFMNVLKSKGRRVDRKNIYSLFEGKTLEDSKKALQYSINQKFVTLYFNDKSKGYDKSGAGKAPFGRGAGFKSGGSTHRDEVSSWGGTPIE